MGALAGGSKPYMHQNLSRSSRITAKRMIKHQLEKKIEKRLVLKTGIPIMRLHRHGGCESLHTTAGPVEEKNPEIQG